MGPVAPAGVANPVRRVPANGRIGICGLPSCCSGNPCASRDLRHRPTLAAAEVPACFASIAASRSTAFWRRSHAFVSPGPLVIKRLQASSQAGRQRTAPGLDANYQATLSCPRMTGALPLDLTADLSWCRPDPASRLRSDGY